MPLPDRIRAGLIWAALVLALGVPLALAATSPLLAWRDVVYIVSGFAGILGMGLLMVQPLLAGADLPHLSRAFSRRIHRVVGALLVAAIVVHVGGLWITSPPDVIDALTFSSPTPFSVWGVVAMWAVFATALLASLRKRLRSRLWRRAHVGLGAVVAVGTVVHALLITGTMETLSKVALSALVLALCARMAWRLR